MWAVPNDAIGAWVSAKDAMRSNELKATGLLSGVWDLHCFVAGRLHIIETKFGKNGLTVDRVVKGKKIYGQKEWGEIMAAEGAIRHIYRTQEEGIAVLETIIRSRSAGYGSTIKHFKQ